VYPQPSDSVFDYHTPYEKDKGPQPPANGRLSSYDNSYAFWGSLHETSLRIFEQYPFLSGMFIWQGIDYLGEPTPYEWPARSSYFGVADLAGFPKDPYYLYQSVWTDRPMLHLFPHWNWQPGDTIDVWAYTNAEEVELFLNGRSLGSKRKSEPVSHLVWRVPYAAGTLHAVARTAGRVVTTATVQTTGAPARVALAPDRGRIHAGGDDLSFVTVTVQDRAGRDVPTAEPRVRVRITGGSDARIVGVDNGDAFSHASFQAHEITLFNGKALVIVRAGRRPGTATLTAQSDGLAPATVRIQMEPR
jgi:beta-galactosidase